MKSSTLPLLIGAFSLLAMPENGVFAQEESTQQEATEKAADKVEKTDQEATEIAKEKVGSGKEEADAAKEKAAKAKTDMAMKRQLANAESRYRVRSAKLAKLATIAEEKGDQEMIGRIAKLQTKNEGIRERKIVQLREKYGDETVDSGLKKVEAVAGNRKAVAEKVRSKAKGKKGGKPEKVGGKPVKKDGKPAKKGGRSS